jgi:hypothetical protein
LIKQTQVIIVLLLASILLLSPTLTVYSSTDEREQEAGEESEPETGDEGSTEEEQTQGQENEERERESLPYCDTPEGNAAQSCHDRDDYDEDTGLYPCNDGSQKTNPDDCPDASQDTQQSADDSNNGRGRNYSPTLPDVEDLNCGDDDIEGSVIVIGEDVYGLDRDKDGIGCENNE